VRYLIYGKLKLKLKYSKFAKPVCRPGSQLCRPIITVYEARSIDIKAVKMER